jgi:Ni,Fe-hydrogenase I small subunit
MRVLWLQSGGCGGCTQSLLCAEPRPLFDELRDAGIEFVWHPALSLESGEEALQVLTDCADGKVAFDVLCVEGAMLRGPNGSGKFHLMAGSGRPLTEWVERLAVHAKWVFAIGSCTAYGGFSASTPGNPLEACGLQYDTDEMGGLLGKPICFRRWLAGGQYCRLPDASRLGRRYAGKAGAGRLAGQRPG